MFKFPYFKAQDQEQVLEFMNQHNFITLIGYDGEFPVATQVPVEIKAEGEYIRFVGHVMTKTDHCHAFQKNKQIMALFTGAHAYVSASVYDDPAVASTWNYMTVQAKGLIRLMDADETYAVIKSLTDKYEPEGKSPASFHQMTDAYIQKHLKAIMGFEITVTSLEHVFKLSQNHTCANRQNIVDLLEKNGDVQANEIAKEMKKNR